jgi:membrane protein YdbS with pleckstrin-like domain
LYGGCKCIRHLYFIFAPMMLTAEEEKFMEYWERNRLRKKRLIWQLAGGLPLGVLLAAAILVNYFSGWYTRADMQIRVSSSGVLVVLIGLLLIVVFVVVFSGRHRWEMNEQRYKELLYKKKIS